MKRKLLSNLPDIVYDGNNVAFSANLLSALLQGVGERCEKAKLVALSGQGNRFCWTDGAWAFGNEETSSIDQAPLHHSAAYCTLWGGIRAFKSRKSKRWILLKYVRRLFPPLIKAILFWCGISNRTTATAICSLVTKKTGSGW